MSSVSGFGRVGYGDGPWGAPGPVSVTGIAGTGGVGSVIIGEGAPVTGIAATGSVGSVSIALGQDVTGIAATTGVGTIDWFLVNDGQVPNWTEIAA